MQRGGGGHCSYVGSARRETQNKMPAPEKITFLREESVIADEIFNARTEKEKIGIGQSLPHNRMQSTRSRVCYLT